MSIVGSNGHVPQPPPTYSEIFAFVATMQDGMEGIPMVRQRAQDGTMMVSPLLAVDIEQLPEMHQIAEKMVANTGEPLELIRFSVREHVEWVGQDPDEEPEPEPPAPIVHCLGDCGQRLFGDMIGRGYCRGCVPKDADLPARPDAG